MVETAENVPGYFNQVFGFFNEMILVKRKLRLQKILQCKILFILCVFYFWDFFKLSPGKSFLSLMKTNLTASLPDLFESLGYLNDKKKAI